jgi:hypothetical protein
MDEIFFFDFSQDGFVEGCTHIIYTEGVWGDHHTEDEYRACELELNK